MNKDLNTDIFLFGYNKFINSVNEDIWARSLMDRIPGFGPVDRGSIPRGLI